VVRNRTKIKLNLYPRSCLHRLCSTHGQRSTPPILYPCSLVLVSLPTISSGFSTHDQFWFLYPRSVPVSLPTISFGFSTHDQFRFLYPRSVLVSLPTVSSQLSDQGDGQLPRYIATVTTTVSSTTENRKKSCTYIRCKMLYVAVVKLSKDCRKRNSGNLKAWY